MNNTIKKISKVFLPTFLGLFLFGSIASAHVEVTPKSSVTGEEETYTVRVPSEKNIPTTKLTIKIPNGLEFDSFEPLAGWNFTTEKGSDGKVKTITFKATGQGILPGEFQRFVFIAVNPDKPTKAAWDAYQYYKDGSIVEWTGNEGTDTPHSITDIVTSTTVQHDATPNSTAHNDHPKNVTSSNSLPLIISIVSVLLSLIAVIFSFRKK